MEVVRPDYEGLQTVSPTHGAVGLDHEGPQAMSPAYNAPEVVYTWPHDANGDVSAHQWQQGKPEDSRAIQPDYDAVEASKPSMTGSDEYKTPVIRKTDRKILGLKRRTFWIVLGSCILLVAVVGAVVGGVLGSRHHGSNTSSSSEASSSMPASTVSDAAIVTQKNGGYTFLVPVDDNSTQDAYLYYLAANGSIIERHSKNISQSSDSNSQAQEQVVVNSGIANGSPLTAVSWSEQGAIFRQLFYVNGEGLVMTTNTSSADGMWGAPYSIFDDDTVDVNALGFTAYASTGTSGLDGMRIYYGSTKGYVQELGLDFNSSQTVWHAWTAFPGSDPASGIATTFHDEIAHLYYRNESDSTLIQWTYDFSKAGQWEMTATGPSNFTAGGDIAATFDGVATDTIFYQADGGVLERAIWEGQNALVGLQTINQTSIGTKLAAISVENSNKETAAMVAFQSSRNTQSMVEFAQIIRSGEVIDQGLL